MEHYSESSGGGRVRSRLHGGSSTRIALVGLDPIGELSDFPLIPCPDCHIARVVGGWTKKGNENHGRLYFKCAKNVVSCLLDFPKLA